VLEDRKKSHRSGIRIAFRAAGDKKRQVYSGQGDGTTHLVLRWGTDDPGNRRYNGV
jgi:hypothetical protein